MAARGHAYTLEDLTKTQRPHGKANCITCKTPDYTKLVNEKGVEAYSLPFDEVIGQMTQAISCYTCHGDDKGNNGQIEITHSYVDKALGENASSIDPKTLNCGQCHIEYYFTPEDSETMMPYSDQDGMTPEAILAYYDEIGFKDWEQPGTGTQMLKAQHPEMETFLPSQHAKMGLTCSSCHMAEETAEDGSTYHSHYLVSPLASDTLMETCAACHGSADSARTLVASTQERVTTRETEVGNRLSDLKDALTTAVAEGKMSEEELDAVRKLHREAQWFFDFCYVENSEGAHNSKLSIRCLDTADEKITEAMALLTGETPAQEETGMVPSDNEGLVAVEQGFGGDVTVHLELNDDQSVKSLVIDTPNETAGLGQRASEAAFTDQFIGKTGPFTYGENGIEALSGATVTSEAALRAINALAGSGAAETPAEEQQETPAAVSGFKAVEQGFGGDVTVRMELNDDRTVKSLDIETPNETAGLGQRASEAEFTDQFIGKTGPFTYGEDGIEALSGATVTSNAALKAINTIVTDGKPDAEEPAEEPAEEKTAEEQPAETPAKTEEKSGSDGQVYGSYLSEKETNFSTIRVTVSTKNDVITDCKITSEAKSEGSDFLTDEIKTEWAKAIVENQGAEADAITGATLQFSAGAVKEAVAEIRQQIAGTPAAAEEPAEAPAEEPAAEQPEEEKAEEAKPEAAAEEPAEQSAAEEPAAEEPAAEEAEPEAAAEQPAEEPAAAEEAPAPAPYGGYLAVKETAFSTIRVIVTTRNGVITDCKVLCDAKEGQTDLVTDENEDAWAKAVVATQGAEPDAVTGATVSSDAVREAVAEILERIR